MIDEFIDRQHRAGREALNNSLDNAFARIGSAVSETFRVSRRIHYSAPWQKRSDATCG